MAAGGPTTDRRRGKAALFLMGCGCAGIAPHWMGPLKGLLPSVVLALLLGGYSLRTVLVTFRRRAAPAPLREPEEGAGTDLPAVDVVVAARDEQAVIGSLVERMARLRYPEGRLRLWVIDDGSEDRTPELLGELEGRFPQLRVLRRPRDAGGGKSAALNAVLPRLEGRWLLVLDADADLRGDVLLRLIPWAEQGGWAAVQLRKAETNAAVNPLTRAQALEMVLDAVVQEGRLANGGVAELRGNGQLLKREAVLAVGGLNEATVTDDLDLSFRFLLGNQPIGLLWDPPVEEEAVLTLRALWRQRQRWAEGGLQRFLDYGPQLFGGGLKASVRLDLACFLLLQYALPTVAAADLLGAAVSRTPPIAWPFSLVTLGLSGLAIASGCRRGAEGPTPPPLTPVNLALVMLYLTHWLVVIPWVTLRMALLPKRLVWAKTAHLGEAAALVEEDDDEPEEGEPELATEAGNL